MRISLDREYSAKLETFTYYMSLPSEDIIKVVIDFLFDNISVQKLLREYYKQQYKPEKVVYVRVRKFSKNRKTVRVPDTLKELLIKKIKELIKNHKIVMKRIDFIRLTILLLSQEKISFEFRRSDYISYTHTTTIHIDETIYKLLISLRDKFAPDEPLGYFLYDLINSVDVNQVAKTVCHGGL